MKKILLTFALVGFVFAANAQLFISANGGGSVTSGTLSQTTRISIQKDTSYTLKNDLPKQTSWTAGLKVGYRYKRFQLGVSGSYSSTNESNLPIDSTLVPNYSALSKFGTADIKGNMNRTTTSFTIAPYFRAEVIQAGDIALFLELSGFYTKVNDPSVTSHLDVSLNRAALLTADTSFTQLKHSTSLGARLTPGLSWQISKHCGVDLYFDFLSFTYSSIKTMARTYYFQPLYTSSEFTGYRTQDVHDEETTETIIGGGLTGTPLLTKLNEHNWVRVGFNFTF